MSLYNPNVPWSTTIEDTWYGYLKPITQKPGTGISNELRKRIALELLGELYQRTPPYVRIQKQ